MKHSGCGTLLAVLFVFVLIVGALSEGESEDSQGTSAQASKQKELRKERRECKREDRHDLADWKSDAAISGPSRQRDRHMWREAGQRCEEVEGVLVPLADLRRARYRYYLNEARDEIEYAPKTAVRYARRAWRIRSTRSAKRVLNRSLAAVQAETRASAAAASAPDVDSYDYDVPDIDMPGRGW